MLVQIGGSLSFPRKDGAHVFDGLNLAEADRKQLHGVKNVKYLLLFTVTLFFLESIPSVGSVRTRIRQSRFFPRARAI